MKISDRRLHGLRKYAGTELAVEVYTELLQRRREVRRLRRAMQCADTLLNLSAGFLKTHGTARIQNILRSALKPQRGGK